MITVKKLAEELGVRTTVVLSEANHRGIQVEEMEEKITVRAKVLTKADAERLRQALRR